MSAQRTEGSRTEGTGELRHGILGIFDTLAQSVALLSLALGVAFAGSAAAAETGAAVPLAYLIAGVGSLCLASVIIRFTRRMASAGGLYTYGSCSGCLRCSRSSTSASRPARSSRSRRSASVRFSCSRSSSSQRAAIRA